MKNLKDLREEISRMNQQEIGVETTTAQIRIARASERIAFYLEKISDNIENLRLY